MTLNSNYVLNYFLKNIFIYLLKTLSFLSFIRGKQLPLRLRLSNLRLKHERIPWLTIPVNQTSYMVLLRNYWKQKYRLYLHNPWGLDLWVIYSNVNLYIVRLCIKILVLMYSFQFILIWCYKQLYNLFFSQENKYKENDFLKKIKIKKMNYHERKLFACQIPIA